MTDFSQHGSPDAPPSLVPVTIVQTWENPRVLKVAVYQETSGLALSYVTRVEVHPETKTARIFVAKRRPEPLNRPASVVWPDYMAEVIEEDAQP